MPPPQLRSDDLWGHFDVAACAMKDGTKLGIHNLEPVGNGLNGRRVIALVLKEAGHTALAAFRTPKLLVPLVVHQMDTRSGLLWFPTKQATSYSNQTRMESAA